MLNKTPIEETFRNAFENFEADVNERVWANIEQHLATPAAHATGNIGGEAVKTILTGSKYSALTYGIASSLVIAIVGLSYYFLSPSNKETTIAKPVKITPAKEAIKNNISAQVNNLTADSKHENTLSLPKRDKKKTKKADAINTPTNQESQNRQNIPNESDNNSQHVTSPITTDEHGEVNNVGDKPVQTENPKENKAPSTADEKHESNNSEVGTNANQEPQVEKSSQNDDFEWGVIANSFSPNNDGSNDFFSIKTPGLKSILVIIYDRNGNIVYKWNNVDGSWDGRSLKGKEMPVGLYLYYIFAELPEGKFHSKNGTISIFR